MVRFPRTEAEGGDAKAQFNSGLMYYNGEGVGHDYKEAVKWYRKLVEGWHILSVELRQAIVKMVW